MKRLWQLTIILLTFFAVSATVQASSLREYEDARDIYDSALACMASYSDRLGFIGTSRLEQDGWTVHYFKIKKELADAKFIFMQKTDPTSGHVTVMLAIAGTETEKDIKSDLKCEQVYFSGSNLAQFDLAAQTKVSGGSWPKVHKGFNQVTQYALAADITDGPGVDTAT